jgi:hypothetical protein
MARDLVPELHDVLKLTRTHSHDPARRPAGGPNTATWRGVLHHYDPTDAETLRLHFADRLAAASSRPESYGGAQAVHATYKLWVGGASGPLPPLPEHEVMAFLATDPDWPEFCACYGDALDSRAENAGGGLNVTSLRAHMELTGKFHRLLTGALDVGLGGQQPAWGDRGLREVVAQKATLTVSHVRVEFPQRPVRAKDLNVLIALDETVARIARDYGDNVIFAAGDELLTVWTGAAGATAMEAELTEAGFWLRAREVAGTLWQWLNPPATAPAAARTSLLQLAEEPARTVYGPLAHSLRPPICEICRMARGTHTWSGPDDEGPEELLCPNCYDYRQRGARLPKLAAWEGDPTTERLGWLLLELPVPRLIECLRKLYDDYLTQLGAPPPRAGAEVRFSLLAEFHRDYQRFLESLSVALQDRFSEGNVQQVLPNLHCLRFDAMGQALDVLEAYRHQVEKFMPAFLATDHCPLLARLIVADPRFPFGEIWRFGREATADVEVDLVGGRRLRTTHQRLADVLSLRGERLRPAALHRLAGIARESDHLAELHWRDRSRPGDPDTRAYRTIAKHLQGAQAEGPGLDFEGLLALVQIQSSAKPRGRGA